LAIVALASNGGRERFANSLYKKLKRSGGLSSSIGIVVFVFGVSRLQQGAGEAPFLI
jgi:hypothetical protein